jgi:hypothetical protein
MRQIADREPVASYAYTKFPGRGDLKQPFGQVYSEDLAHSDRRLCTYTHTCLWLKPFMRRM